MSKTLKISLIVILLIVLGFVIFIYVGFAGLPWKKWTVGNETLEYLEHKYGEEFEIEDRFYNFKDGSYNIKVHPAREPTLTFTAGEGWGRHEFIDYYPEEVWTKQADREFRDIVEQLFPERRRYNVSTVYGEGIDKVQTAPIPHYVESDAFIDVYVSLPIRFEESDEEFERMLKLVQFAKEKGGNIHIFLVYEPADEQTKETFYVNFSNKEINEIKSVEDVKKYYNNLEIDGKSS